MYGYIYDVFLNDKRYEKDLIKIENSLTDLDLRGQVVRLTLLNNLERNLQDLLQRGVKTLVTIGGDQLFSRLTDFADTLQCVTLGLLPLGPNQYLANLFGIPSGEGACQVLSARNIQPVPLGKINGGYFIHSVFIDDPRVKIGCDNNFAASATTEQSITSIHNLLSTDTINRKDDHLSVRIAPSPEKKFLKKGVDIPPTIIQTKNVTIKYPPNIRILVDGQKVMKTPARIQIADTTINVIMGRKRRI